MRRLFLDTSLLSGGLFGVRSVPFLAVVGVLPFFKCPESLVSDATGWCLLQGVGVALAAVERDKLVETVAVEGGGMREGVCVMRNNRSVGDGVEGVTFGMTSLLLDKTAGEGKLTGLSVFPRGTGDVGDLSEVTKDDFDSNSTSVVDGASLNGCVVDAVVH